MKISHRRCIFYLTLIAAAFVFTHVKTASAAQGTSSEWRASAMNLYYDGDPEAARIAYPKGDADVVTSHCVIEDTHGSSKVEPKTAKFILERTIEVPPSLDGAGTGAAAMTVGTLDIGTFAVLVPNQQYIRSDPKWAFDEDDELDPHAKEGDDESEMQVLLSLFIGLLTQNECMDVALYRTLEDVGNASKAVQVWASPSANPVCGVRLSPAVRQLLDAKQPKAQPPRGPSPFSTFSAPACKLVGVTHFGFSFVPAIALQPGPSPRFCRKSQKVRSVGRRNYVEVNCSLVVSVRVWHPSDSSEIAAPSSSVHMKIASAVTRFHSGTVVSRNGGRTYLENLTILNSEDLHTPQPNIEGGGGTGTPRSLRYGSIVRCSSLKLSPSFWDTGMCESTSSVSPEPNADNDDAIGITVLRLCLLASLLAFFVSFSVMRMTSNKWSR